MSFIRTDSRDGEEYDLSFNAINGVPEDKTEEYLSEYPEYQWIERDEWVYIYTFDHHFGKSEWVYWFNEEVNLGVVGFGY